MGHALGSAEKEERKEFVAWVNSLELARFGGKSDPAPPENVHQLRIVGYPERVIPLPKDYEKSAIGADGMRPADGMMADAKYVQDAGNDCRKNTWRRPSTFESALEKYRQAMNEHRQIRGLGIVTNTKEAAAYRPTLMVFQQLPGIARYVNDPPQEGHLP
ncbi:restriction endonuclease fold toxin-2 domain-containing protein [Streptomyces sp. NPDC004284]|uniref:restriction endonuclease fold toxin-2 domain-containing protein n=1 Tax=Streptomyces sp. NPDC004284 TaxID=3364695 RepID=UPI0036B18940